MRISDRLARLAPSATLVMASRAAALRSQGIDVIAFAAGQPDFDTPQHIKQAACDALAAGDTKYPSPVSGVPALREAACAYLKQYGGVEYDAGEICVAVGAKDALFLAFASLVNPGDEVLIPAPYWVSYPDQVGLMGGTPVFVHPRDGGFKVSGADIRSAITPRTRLLVLNSPSNPSGAVYTRGELEEIAAAIRDTDVCVISDEIYNRLIYTDEPYVSFASLPEMRERTLTINGMSKSFAMTGWRLGFAAGPKDVIQAMARLQGQSTSGPASFVQTASAAALRGDQTCVDEMRAAYRRRGLLMSRGLDALPGVRCGEPQGAFYCFPDVSGTFEMLGVRDADGFAEALLDRAHVAAVSGVAFGSPTHVRFSYATSEEQIRAGLERMAKLLGG
ncbi:MAG: pyridoxal phosphate-dependent aminotransferase [Planctomycetota bacterium]|nr:MAG: pyridoxal phosphate-dependent aminotransferase [Planctomycetota bacterium]